MSKSSVILTLILTLSLGPAVGVMPAQAAKFEIKLSHSAPSVPDRVEVAARIFKDYVEKATNGDIIVTTYPASQLGGEREQAEGVQMGTIEMAALSTGPIPGMYPEIMLLDLPFIFPDMESAHALLDGPYLQRTADDMLKKTGTMRLLGFFENGFRCFTGNRPLTKPADFKGMKFRLMENPMHQAMVKSLGGIPSTIPFAEVYTALAQGVVDGQENPLSLIYSMRFYEVQKHMILDQHVYNPYLVLINNDFFMNLPENYRKIIEDGSRVFIEEERKLNVIQSNEGLEYMKSQGMSVVVPSPEVLKEFKDSTMETHAILRKRFGDKLVDDFLADVDKAIAATRK